MPRDRAPAHSFLSTCSTLSGPSISLCSSTHPLSTFCAPPPPLAGGEGVDSRTQRVETTRPGAAPRRVASCRTVCSTPRLSASGTSSSPRPTRPSSDSTSHAASAASPSTASDPAQRAPRDEPSTATPAPDCPAPPLGAAPEWAAAPTAAASRARTHRSRRTVRWRRCRAAWRRSSRRAARQSRSRPGSWCARHTLTATTVASAAPDLARLRGRTLPCVASRTQPSAEQRLCRVSTSKARRCREHHM
jgi:hypothetical protein